MGIKEIEYTEQHKQEIIECIKKFNLKEDIISKLICIINDMEIDEISNAYQNIVVNKLEIKRKTFYMSWFPVKEGFYDYTKNILYYLHQNSIIHEFLHLISSSYETLNGEEIIKSGFMESFNNLEIGRAITEGYTELLTLRINNKKNNSFCNSYPFLVDVISLIELFFEDNSDLKRMYYKNDLNGFVYYLGYFFDNERKVMNLILSIDEYKYGDVVDLNKLKDEIFTTIISSIIRNVQDLNRLKLLNEMLICRLAFPSKMKILVELKNKLHQIRMKDATKKIVLNNKLV